MSVLASLKARRAAVRGTPSTTPGDADNPAASGFAAGFSTPLSSTAGGLQGGVQGIGELSLSGGGDAFASVFRLDDSIMENICGGIIKGGLRFCTKGRGVCLAKSHDKKAEIFSNHLYILGPGSSAFTHHALDLSRVSSTQVSRLLAESNTVTDWARLFHVLGGYVDELDDTDMGELMKQTQVALPVGMTPKRRRVLYTSDEPGEFLASMTPLADLGEEEDPLARMISQWDRLVNQVKTHAEDASSFKARICDDLNELGVLMKCLEASIGTNSGSDQAHEGVSVWEGLQVLRTDAEVQSVRLTGVSDGLDLLGSEIDTIKEDCAELDGKVTDTDNAAREFADISSFLSEEQENVIADIATLKAQILNLQSLKPAVVPKPGEATAPDHARLSSQWRRDVEMLKSMLTNLEADVGLRMARMEKLVGEKFAEWDSTRSVSAAPTSAVESNLRAEVASLREELKLVKARIASKAVTLGGRVFSSLPDVVLFVTKYVPPNLYFLFHEVVSLLESINDAYTTRKEVMLELSQGQKVGFKNQSESSYVASFKMVLPSQMCRSSDGNVPAGTAAYPLPAIKSFAVWNPFDGSTGTRAFIESGIDDLQNTLGHDIATYLEDFPEAQALASLMLAKTHAFLTDFCSWVDKFYQELLTSSGSTKELIWDLISRCIRAMFEELRKVRAGAQNASSDPDDISKCAKFLWAVVQAHDVMQTFKDLRFSHHPVIAPVVNYHVHKSMATKASITQLKEQIALLTKQVAHFDSLQGRLAKLEKK